MCRRIVTVVLRQQTTKALKGFPARGMNKEAVGLQLGDSDSRQRLWTRHVPQCGQLFKTVLGKNTRSRAHVLQYCEHKHKTQACTKQENIFYKNICIFADVSKVLEQTPMRGDGQEWRLVAGMGVGWGIKAERALHRPMTTTGQQPRGMTNSTSCIRS